MLFDTHCHTYLSKEKTETEILEEIKEKNNLFITNIGVDLEKSQHCIDVASKYDFAYATVGIHPCDIGKYNDLDDAIQKLEILSKNKKVVAIGECGLDYYRLERELKTGNLEQTPPCSLSFAFPPQLRGTKGECSSDTSKGTIQGRFPTSMEGQSILEQRKQLQIEYFIAQIELAKKLNLPVIIHNREAKDDVFEILETTNYKNFVLHCYSENIEYALKLLDFSPNCMISFSGILTFNSAKAIQETASKIPLKNIMIETDAPYLSPTPFRGQENYPQYVEKVLDKICVLRSESSEEIKKAIWENSLRFYGI